MTGSSPGIGKFILRIDDVGQALDQSQPDYDLKYFREWWTAGGWGDQPIYLGVVPAVMRRRELEYLYEIVYGSKAVICLHGWDHAREILTRESIRRGSEMFPSARHVIPPYNLYDRATIDAIEEFLVQPKERPPVIFGGFHGEDHHYGDFPKMIGNVLHLSAIRILYARSYQIIEALDKVAGYPYPQVITLHHRWEQNFLPAVGELRQRLDGLLVSTDEIQP